MKNADPLRFLKRKKDRTPSKHAIQSSRSQPCTDGFVSINQSKLQQSVLLKQNCYDPNKYYSNSCEIYLKNSNYLQTKNNRIKSSPQNLEKKQINQKQEENQESLQDILVSFKKTNQFREKQQEVKYVTFKKINFQESQGTSNPSKPTITEQNYQIDPFPQQINNLQSQNEMELKQCLVCGRKFNLKSYNKHTKICQKVFVNKRKQFSSEKQRSQSKQKKK